MKNSYYVNVLLCIFTLILFPMKSLASETEKDYLVEFNDLIFDFEAIDFENSKLSNNALIKVTNKSKKKQLFHIWIATVGEGLSPSYQEQSFLLEPGTFNECVFPIILDSEKYRSLESATYGVQFTIENEIIEDANEVIKNKEKDEPIEEQTDSSSNIPEESETEESVTVESETETIESSEEVTEPESTENTQPEEGTTIDSSTEELNFPEETTDDNEIGESDTFVKEPTLYQVTLSFLGLAVLKRKRNL